MQAIAIWGDSITYGDYDNESGGWARRFYSAVRGLDRRGPSFFNLSIRSNKLADVIARFDAECAARDPDIILLAVGTNDSPHASYPQGTDLKVFEERYRVLLAKSCAQTTSVIAVGPTNVSAKYIEDRGYTDETIRPYRDSIKALAAEYAVPFVDLFGSLTDEDQAIDGIHPTAEGHAKIAQIVTSAFKEMQ